MPHGGAVTKAAGAGGNPPFPEVAVLDEPVTGPSEATAGLATFWLTPIAPTTLPASDAGTERALLARRTTVPLTLYSPSVVPNARST